MARYRLPEFAVMLSMFTTQGVAQSIYRDPQLRFTLAVPAGWTASASDMGAAVVRGRAYVNVLVAGADDSAANIIAAVSAQVGRQWKQVQELKRGDHALGGLPGAFVFFGGTNPAGLRAFLKVCAASAGGKSYVLFLSAPEGEYAAVKGDLDAIEAGFSPGAGAPAASPAPRADAGKAAALEAAYKAGILTHEEYEAKKRQLIAGTAAAPAAPGADFQAPDGSFTTRVPPGWKGRSVQNPQPMNVFEPDGGGQERIIVMSAPVTAGSIQELAQQAAGMVMQLFPGLRPTGQASFSQVSGSPAAEISYSGIMATGQQIRGWHGVILKERSAFGVLAVAMPETAAKTEEAARFLYQNLRPGRVPENTQLASSIVGRWTFYQGRSDGARDSSSVSRVITFSADGRFEYISMVAVSNPTGSGGSGETRHTGTYRVQGNMLLVQVDGAGPASYTLEVVPGGTLKIGGEMYIRE